MSSIQSAPKNKKSTSKKMSKLTSKNKSISSKRESEQLVSASKRSKYVYNNGILDHSVQSQDFFGDSES